MSGETHFHKLERMYLSAPVNDLYEPQIKIEEGTAEIIGLVDTRFFHAAKALHGSVYFKMLDDAAFFASNSVVEDVFVLTGSFEIQFLKPVSEGSLWAVGKIKSNTEKLIVAEATLYDEDENVIATGNGNFLRSKIVLNEDIGYK